MPFDGLAAQEVFDMHRFNAGTRGRLVALMIALALLGGGLAVAGHTPTAYGVGATNRDCVEGPCTKTVLSSGANPSVVGQTVTYTATVSPSARPPSGAPGGTVAFSDGGTPVVGCTVQTLFASGQATCTVTYTSVGTHAIVANYSGDGTFRASASASLTQTVNRAATTTSLQSNLSPSRVNELVTYAATVAPASGTGPATGTVAFSEGGSLIAGCGARTVSALGQATCSTSYPAVGTHLITATYGGDVSFSGSSGTLTQTVQPGPQRPDISLSAPAPGARYAFGQHVVASYSCHEAPGGPGIKSCVGSSPSGAAITTAKAGTYAFIVTATSLDGQSATSVSRYTVLRPSNRFTISNLAVHNGGRALSFDLNLPGPGGIDVLETEWRDNLRAGVAALQPAPRRIALSRLRFHARHGGTVPVSVTLNSVGRRLLKSHRYRVQVRLWVSFTPTGGLTHSEGIVGIKLTRP
jgi:hypothetical protein